jgi:DNA-binding IclR family transcriptional regulator
VDGINEHRSVLPNFNQGKTSTKNMGKQQKTIGSVQRAMDILDLFDRRTQELGVTEIARALNLAKSTIAGLIFTLEQNDYLDQNTVNRKYRLGFKLAERAGVFLDQFDLRRAALPVLEELRDSSNESVNLAIRDGQFVTYIERMLGNNVLGMRSEIGKRELIHSTALGKALLAQLPTAELNKFIAGYDFTPVTPHTIIDPVAFLAEIQETSIRGFAVDNQENELGGRCVAAAIYDYHGDPVAAISVSVPIQRFPEEKTSEFGAMVKRAARAISLQLGANLFEEHEKR